MVVLLIRFAMLILMLYLNFILSMFRLRETSISSWIARSTRKKGEMVFVIALLFAPLRIFRQGLIDLGYKGPHYTWCNNQSGSCSWEAWSGGTTFFLTCFRRHAPSSFGFWSCSILFFSWSRPKRKIFRCEARKRIPKWLKRVKAYQPSAMALEKFSSKLLVTQFMLTNWNRDSVGQLD